MARRSIFEIVKNILFVTILAAGAAHADESPKPVDAAADSRAGVAAFDDWSTDAPSFRWVELTAFPGELPDGEPWSPTKSWLVFSGVGEPRALQAIDPSAEHAAPWHLADADPLRVGWSPDGTWVSVIARSTGAASAPAADGERAPDRTLFVCPAERDLRARTTTPLAAGYGGIQSIWGADGRIWYRISSRAANWQVARAPEEWVAAHGAANATLAASAAPMRTFLTLDVPWTSTDPATCVTAVEVGAEWPTERVVPLVRVNEGSARVVDVFPKGERVLAHSIPIEGLGSIAVLEPDGRVQSRFTQVLEPFTTADGARRDRGTFEPASVSSDGTLLIGTRRIEDESGTVVSVLCVGDAAGRWIVPLEGAPQGIAPRCARVGPWVAFRDLKAPVLHVGRIERSAE